jgi:hypothetical protein
MDLIKVFFFIFYYYYFRKSNFRCRIVCAYAMPLRTNFGSSKSNNAQKSLCDISENQKGFQIDSQNIVNDDENLNISKASKPVP